MNSRVIIIAILIMIKVIGVASRVKADDIDFQPWKPIYEYEILCDAKNKEKSESPAPQPLKILKTNTGHDSNVVEVGM